MCAANGGLSRSTHGSCVYLGRRVELQRRQRRTWKALHNKHCSRTTYGATYSSLAAAENACSRTNKCGGVYDSSCNMRGSFKLCVANRKLGVSSSKRHSCVYSCTGHKCPSGRIHIPAKHMRQVPDRNRKDYQSCHSGHGHGQKYPYKLTKRLKATLYGCANRDRLDKRHN